MKLGVIVEGHGEVEAAPILLRRVLTELLNRHDVEILRPDRRKRGQLAKQEEFTRAIEAMARRVGETGAVLVILDADADATCVLGPQLLSWAQDARPDRSIGIVVARREWESWYVAGVASLRGSRMLEPTAFHEGDPELMSSPKGWLAQRMARGYTETLDQPAFAARLDLQQARTTYSFDKLVRELARVTNGIPAGAAGDDVAGN